VKPPRSKARDGRKKAPAKPRSGVNPAEVVGQTLERAFDPLANVLKKAALNRAERSRKHLESMKPAPAAARPRVQVSPLATPFPAIPAVAGVELSAVRAGLHRRQRADVMVMRFAPGTIAAGVFTRHATAAAPVDWCRRQLETGAGQARALVANAGCANALTGKAGFDASRRLAAAVAKRLDCPRREILLASTGPIGAVLDDGKITGRLPALVAGLSPGGWEDAARAIMTTDTFTKGAFATAEIEGVTVRIAGIAKGSGMVSPDMATVLAFVATDAALTQPALQNLVGLYTRMTFNRVTVDGDSSPNDCVLLFATGGSGAPLVSRAGDRRLADFREKLEQVMLGLAWQIVRDGEGATKFVTVQVTGAESPHSARRIARSIAESPGVKAALGGESANWGRVVAAVGDCDEPVRRERLSVRFGEVATVVDGAVASSYREAALLDYMKRDEIEISVEVGVGRSSATVWTCDLTRRYVDINQSPRF
jgi:glutamate N-acetyltransferase/amino-acid N-acetyltransferase